MTRQPIYLFFVALTALLATACSQNLTRSDAQRQLEEKYLNEYRGTEKIETARRNVQGGTRGHICLKVATGKFQSWFPETAALSDAGFVKANVLESSIKEEACSNILNYTPGGIFDYITIEPTTKLKPFIVKELPMGSYSNDSSYIEVLTANPQIEITGITAPSDAFGKRMCTVNFRISFKNNEIGDLLKKRYEARDKEQAFIKYDNGWRLEK